MEPEITQQPARDDEAREPGIAGLEAVFADLEKRLDELVAARLDAVEDRLRQTERDALLARFADERPDFRDLAANGTLAAEKRANPLLDDVGAYYAHCLAVERDGRAGLLEETRLIAAAEAEARTMERFRAKRLARALGAAPAGAGRGGGREPELAAPEKFGGIHAVLAARLAERRKTADI